MDLGFKNKKALITGASRGLGRAMALKLSQEGAAVALVARSKKDLNEVIAVCGGEKNGHRAFVADLTTEGIPAKIMPKIRDQFGDPEIVINNLGDTLNIRNPFCSVSDWRKIWRINLEVAIEINLLVFPHMRKNKWGRIVNISSIAALENQGPVPYCTVKAALNAYSRSMGRVLAPDEIVMTSILPGAIFTTDGYWDQTSKTNPKHVAKYLKERMAIGRFGKPEELAAVVAFFCSTHVSFCVGSSVAVDGGQGRSFFE